ncbi:MaoC/PaaZ C-terminal domain-containing protein [Streptomyces sp. CA-132043]|uniref:MaoC/PaaZ C-terminal domain-containing protein n=1 Tax=Streptomyces sp. CA-132043 TaxID=3240048 RepID=UPI003D9038A7
MADTRTDLTLARAPRLMPALGKGVLTGIGKRPRPDAPLPAVRLTLPGVRADPARTAAYAEVCGFAAHAPVLPVTYPHILGFPLAARLMSARAFPLPMLGLVHTTIEIVQHAPLPADEPLDLTVYAAELRPHRRGTEAVMVTEARRDGEPVWEDRSTYLARHRTEAASEPATPAPTAPSPAAPALPSRAEWRLAGDLGRRHAAVSGDYNPIHLHPLTARPLGFPRAIAHGMWTFARCAAEAVPEGARAVRIASEFRAPVLLPATVTYAAAGPAFELRAGPDHENRLHLTGEAEIRP